MFFFLPLHIKSKVNKTLFTYKVLFKWFYWTKAALNVVFFHFEFWKLYVSYEAQKGNSKNSINKKKLLKKINDAQNVTCEKWNTIYLHIRVGRTNKTSEKERKRK